MEVIPFLILAVGVDNLCALINHAFSNAMWSQDSNILDFSMPFLMVLHTLLTRTLPLHYSYSTWVHNECLAPSQLVKNVSALHHIYYENN